LFQSIEAAKEGIVKNKKYNRNIILAERIDYD
jgi:hypothetical protein